MNYEAYVFDCDGVLIASNASKAAAFYTATLGYGEASAWALVQYHKRAGSISRRARFEHFFAGILDRDPEPGELDRVMAACTAYVLEGSREAPLMPGVLDYLETLRAAGRDVICVSGIEAEELVPILDGHGLTPFFSRVWGGRTKGPLLRELVSSGEIRRPAIYFGDTEDDFTSAVGAGLDFALVTADSEWTEGPETVSSAGGRVLEDFAGELAGKAA